MDDAEYKVTDYDIEKMLHYLQLTHPKIATPEIAKIALERLHSTFKGVEEFDEDAIEAILKDLEEH